MIELKDFFVRTLYYIWAQTLRIKVVEKSGDPPFIYAFWHRNLFPLIQSHKKKKICVLVSLHSDGELVARLIKSFGFCVVRGSSTRGGLRAAIKILDYLKKGRVVAITPDGPKGPPLKVKPGIIEISKKAGVPIHPVGVACSKAKVLSTWDRFKLPYPFSKCVVYVGDALDPSDVDERKLEMALMKAERKAEEHL